MKRKIFIIVFLNLFLTSICWSQSPNQTLYHFKFIIKDRTIIDQITQIISIDNVTNDTVYAYANENELANFKKLNIYFEFIPETKADKAVTMATTLSEMSSWNKYPTYEVYTEMMQNWVTQYPNLCVLEEIGTLQSGRKLLALKISDNPTYFTENEPKIFLSSSIHGDEIAGYGILLHLIDYLLSNYNTYNSYQINQIVNNSEIWFCPLANPDGSYKGGNASLTSAIRYNGNYVDLNRNFPDPAAGENPDGYSYQQETKFMMDFASKHKFSMGINIHGGVEVVNYPWDTWSKRSPDNNWWKYVGANYRDSAQKNSPAGYLTSISNGLTNGYDWYRITGGRQDYMNYFHRCREFTLEISTTKLYPAANLPNLWNYNRGALIGYINEALQGIHGNIINDKGLPVFAKIEVLNYDKDNSEVFTDSLNGFFTRYLKAGTYKLKISATGYVDGIVDKIDVIDGKQTYLNHILIPTFSKICIKNEPVSLNSYTIDSDSIIIPILNCGNKIENLSAQIENLESNNWIALNNQTLSISPQQEKNYILNFKNSIQNDTTYSCNLKINTNPIIKIPITVNFKPQRILNISKAVINHTLTTKSLLIDTLFVQNLENYPQHLVISKSKVSWLKIRDESVLLNPLQSIGLVYEINSMALSSGFYNTHFELNNGFNYSIPIKLIVDTLPTIEISGFQEDIVVNKNNNYSTSFLLSNKGGGILNFNLNILDEQIPSKILIYPTSGSVAKLDTQKITLTISSENSPIEKYKTSVQLFSEFDTLNLPLSITIDSLPNLYVKTDTIKITSHALGIYKDSIKIENVGGGLLSIVVNEKITNGYSLISLPSHTNSIPGKSSIFLMYAIDATKLQPKIYQSAININNTIIPIIFSLLDEPKFTINKYSINHIIAENEITNDTLIFTNNSDIAMDYSIEKNTNSEWFTTNILSGRIDPYKSAPLIISIDTKGLIPNDYYGKIIIKSNVSIRIPITLKIVASN